MIQWIQARNKLILLICGLIILSTACQVISHDEDTITEPGKEVVYPVDPLFSEFYKFFEKEKSLGSAISPLFIDGITQKQFVEAGLMVFDPQMIENERYYLEPLGRYFGVDEAGVQDHALADSRYINEHNIFGEFLTLYENLGGARYVGLPLVEARHNLEKGRIEQYFENLGFYRLDHDPVSSVHLLSYGVFACDQQCNYKPITASLPSPLDILPEPFASKVSQLGLPFLGLRLSNVIQAADGMQEVVFENVVLVNDQISPDVVFARPIVEIIGIQAQPPIDHLNDPLMVFYISQVDKGHNIPNKIYDYLQSYGGLDFTGPPIAEPDYTEPGIYNQCFTNLCINDDQNSPESERIRLAPLGVVYWERFYNSRKAFLLSQSLESVSLHTWEKIENVTSDQGQEIFVAIYENGVPLENREPLLILTMPDASLREYHFPPTNANGRSSLSIPPINASNGTMIVYEVCLVGLNSDRQCSGGNYLIWNY